MRRRSRPRVVWLPQTNALSLGTGDQVYQLITFAINGVTGDRNVVEVPLVSDSQKGIADVDASLADVESSGYRLRRIVGKIWVQMDQTNNDGPASAVITAGIMVRRAETTSGGSLALLAGQDEIDPGLIDNTGDPWVWRRSWWLSNQLATAAGGAIGFPRVNWGKEYAGGIAEGPHVDQKTARNVSKEERLFLDVSATIVGEGGDPAPPVTIAVLTDLRVLGSLKTSAGNRNNSSR